MKVPEDMRAQIRVGLPLLERQVQRLFPMIREYQKQKQQDEIANLMAKMSPEKILEQFKENVQGLSLEEIQVAYEYLKENPLTLEQVGYQKLQFKKLVLQAEGSVKDSIKRKWLIEIEYLLE